MLHITAPIYPAPCLYRNITFAPSCYHRNHVASNWQTYSGMQDQFKQNDIQRRSLKRIISHPDYNQMTFDYDIALLELSEPLEFTNTIQPICLPSSSHVFPAGMSCWVTGWGTLREGGIMQEFVILCRTVLFFFFFCCFSLWLIILLILNIYTVIPQLCVAYSTIVFPFCISSSHQN